MSYRRRVTGHRAYDIHDWLRMTHDERDKARADAARKRKAANRRRMRRGPEYDTPTTGDTDGSTD